MPIDGALELLARFRLRIAYAMRNAIRANSGIESVNQALLRRTRGVAGILSAFGARIEGPGVIHGPLAIHNAERDYSNLVVGENAHVGRDVLLDLTDRIAIERDATVSMGTVILTHTDVGDRPLAEVLPRRVEPTTIGAGSYVGARAVILAGCHVGARAVVGAGAVVTKPVPAGAVAMGVPARVTSG